MKKYYAFSNQKDNEIFFGVEDDKTDLFFELSIEWNWIGREYQAARVEMYQDSWKSIPHIQDVLSGMAEESGNRISPDDFVKMLERFGYKKDEKSQDNYPLSEARSRSLAIKLRELEGEAQNIRDRLYSGYI